MSGDFGELTVKFEAQFAGERVYRSSISVGADNGLREEAAEAVARLLSAVVATTNIGDEVRVTARVICTNSLHDHYGWQRA